MPQIEINYIDNIVDFSQFKEQEKKKKELREKDEGTVQKYLLCFDCKKY